MKTFEKKLFPLFLALVILASCNSFISTPTINPKDVMVSTISAVSTAVLKTQIAIPLTTHIFPPISPASPTPLLLTDTSIPMSELIVYYYFTTTAENPPPHESVVIMPETYILAPTLSDTTYSPDTAADLMIALETVLNDGRNVWVSGNLDIVDVTFGDSHTDVVLNGEYYGVGDVTLFAASMQILMTVFANSAVKTATVTLNGDTIGNLGVSNSMNAKPADYVFSRSEIETFMNEHGYASP